ncbi:MAG: hemerythrin domain-containing protein [Planctomycetes bacterium]|nr:hemerythrin domain-containing protein [Planctomycetota bacterium]
MDFAQDIDTQHDRIRVLTDRLAILCRSDPAFLPRERWLPVVEHDLHALFDSLTQHFEFEERDGYMNEIVRRDPNQQARAETLLAEHCHMRDGFAALVADLRSMPDRKVFQERLAHLLGTLHDHETAEVEFFQLGLLRDVGVGD